MASPNYDAGTTTTTYTGVKFLRYPTDDIKSESLVIDPSTVEAVAGSTRMVKVLRGGSLVIKITGTDACGPYKSDASDGRQLLPAGSGGYTAFILSADVDVTDGPVAIGGLYDDAQFESAGLQLFGASLATVKAAFPNSKFF